MNAIKDVEEREKVRDVVRLTSKDLASRTVYRRAVDAVIWGLPLVGEDAVKQAAFRDGKANYNDIVWWPKGGGWKNQSPTPNVNTRYMYFFINTRQDGPVVVELPPAVPKPFLRHHRSSTAPSKMLWGAARIIETPG